MDVYEAGRIVHSEEGIRISRPSPTLPVRSVSNLGFHTTHTPRDGRASPLVAF